MREQESTQEQLIRLGQAIRGRPSMAAKVMDRIASLPVDGDGRGTRPAVPVRGRWLRRRLATGRKRRALAFGRVTGSPGRSRL